MIGAGFGLNYLITYASIGAGYNAKMACSCHFISGRSIEDISANDLYSVPMAKQVANEEEKTVMSTVFGLISRKAIYRPGLGCTLIPKGQDVIAGAIQSLSVPHPNVDLQDSILPADKKMSLDKILEDNLSTGTGSRAILVLKEGKIVAEKYAEGFDKDMPLLGWSMAKSLTNTMVGILVRDGILKVENKALLEDWKDDERSAISIDDLLRMSSGLDFVEDYSKVSDVTRMLFLQENLGLFAAQSKLSHKPGEHYYYSSGTTNILQQIIRSTFTEHKYYLEFPYRRLFSKLGMASAVLEPDAGGTYIGSSFMFATARDWAKLGHLYANDGLWNGEQILPPGWVEYSAQETEESDGEYAAHFWTYPRKDGLPKDCLLMDGFEGQFVLVIPSQKLVIVRLGCTKKDDHFDEAAFFKSISDEFL